MNGGDYRCFDQAGIGQRQKVEVIVNQVEISGTLENFGNVQALGDLGID